MPASDYEAPLYRKVLDALARWLGKVKTAVLGAFGQPDPSAVLSRRPAWNKEVDALMPEIEKITAAGWEDASGKEYVSTNSFIIAESARVANFLRNISNEVYALIVAELIEGQQAGETVDELRDRIDRVLTVTGSARWTNRARVIAQTESNRNWNAGVYASALHYEPATGPGWLKIWQAHDDDRTRPSHNRADGQTVGLRDFFQVGSPPFPMLYPGDPRAPAREVVGCRCELDLVERTAT
jgi:hypothetical protein